jgi:hypothetical protein
MVPDFDAPMRTATAMAAHWTEKLPVWSQQTLRKSKDRGSSDAAFALGEQIAPTIRQRDQPHGTHPQVNETP